MVYAWLGLVFGALAALAWLLSLRDAGPARWVAVAVASVALVVGSLWLLREYVAVDCVGGDDPACRRDQAGTGEP